MTTGSVLALPFDVTIENLYDVTYETMLDLTLTVKGDQWFQPLPSHHRTHLALPKDARPPFPPFGWSIS